MKSRTAMLLSTLVLSAAAPAGAAITIDAEPPFPPNPDENVLLTGGVLDFIVLGLTNQTATQVNFLSDENIFAPSNGQARIKADDGEFTFLDITLADPGLGFTAFEFNLDAVADGKVTLTFFDQFNNAVGDSFGLNRNGSNFFNATATGGDLITRVLVSSSVGLSDIAQVRLGVGPIDRDGGGGQAVPEPATWAMMILGFGGVGSLMRRRRAVVAG